MLTRRLPGTDLDLSVLGFGCWAIGGDGWGDDVTEERSTAAVEAALDVGITWFDTAPVYGWGQSEQVLVRALGARRHDVILATKVGVENRDGHAQSNLSPAHLRTDLEATLRRLDVDTIDLLQVHWPCEFGTSLAATFETLAQLKDEGKFRHLGVCNYFAPALREIAAITPIASLQFGYSLLRREVEQELVAACTELDIGLLAYEPLGRGLLTGKFTHEPDFPETDMRGRDDRFKGHRFRHAQRFTGDLGRVARKVGVSTAALAIGWVASRPAVTSVIFGAKGPEQVHQNARAAQLVGKDTLWSVVDKVAALHGGTPA